jgi:exodeoxyribonuclease VII small subunit
MPANRKQPAASAAPRPDARPSAPGATGAKDEPSFEEALERLETIVEELEAGSLSLDQSLARYEEGMRLSRRLTRTLDQAEKRIERLVEEGGDVTTRLLEHAPGESAQGEGDPMANDRAAEGGEGELPF